MPVAVFCSYAHEDEALRDELHKRLKTLERGNLIRVWHDRQILPGGDWDREIDEQLRSADLVLLLISPDFLASEYANDIEVTLAMQRHKKGQAVVVPVILRPSPWESTDFGKLQALPKDGLPVTKWPDRDDAYLDIARGIQRFVEELIEGNRDGFAPVLPEQLKPRVPDAELTALERNYLAQVKADLDDRQVSPLGHSEKEEIALEAQILVEPEYKVFQADVDPSVQPDRGKRTSNLVKTLLHSTEPVVVLGQPGAGKSVALRRVGLRLVELGKDEPEPRIPVYLPLGEFTTRLDTSEPALAFATRTLLKRGGHAAEIAARLRDYLHQGRMVFLLDAMDEMPRDDYKYRFEALRELTRFRGSRFLFACRSLDYRESFKVTRAIIQPLSRKAARELLLRAMPETGREAASRILSPDNPRRNLAGNPFFLRLFCLYYKRHKDLPPSRAALVEVFEQAVYLKASKYDTEGLTFDQRTMHLTLARLGYLIEVSHRGVTLPLPVFRAKFGDGSAELEQCSPHLDEVIRAAATERLLVRDDHIDPGGDTILSFYHHRLQEYYAAVYLEEFDTPLDWTSKYDDIWWQEILIMLFGITESPERYMRDLLATVPEPVTMGKLAPVMARLVASGSDVLGLIQLDQSGFYGLHAVGKPLERADDVILRIFGKRRSEVSYKDTLEARSPKPSNKEDEELVRRHLERRNAVLLDRVELIVECVQNVASPSSDATKRVQEVVSRFIDDGNTWEKVRAISIASKLRGIDLYRLIEPALLRGNTWCRQAALEAVAGAPVESSPLRQVGIVLFLEFLKGDLVFSVPTFAKQVWERRMLLWLAPGFVVLLALSLAVGLAPFLFYWPLRQALPLGPAVVVLSTCILAVYFLKYRFGAKLLYLEALAACFCFPGLKRALSDSELFRVVGAGAAILSPEIVETAFTGVACVLAALLFGSRRIVAAWAATIRDLWTFRNGWLVMQLLLIGAIALIAGWDLCKWLWHGVADSLQRSTGINIDEVLGVAIGILVGLLLLFALLGSLASGIEEFNKVRKAPRDHALRAWARMRDSLLEFGRNALSARLKAVKVVLWICAGLIALAVFFVALGWIFEHKQQVTAATFVLMAVASLFLLVRAVFSFLLPHLAINYYEAFGEPPPAYLAGSRLFQARSEALLLLELISKYSPRSSSERYEAYRRELANFKEDRWQSVLYRQMEKAYKEMRQDAGRKEQ